MPAPDRIEGCPGQYLRLRGTTAAFCYGCDRYERTGPQVKPLAAYSPELGAWDCPNKLTYTGSAPSAGMATPEQGRGV